MAAEDVVAPYSYAILTPEQFALEVPFNEQGSANEQKSRIVEVLNAATDVVESATDRLIMYRGTQAAPVVTTRYYSRDPEAREDPSVLILDEWPVRAVVVYESSTRTWTTPLVANTDYLVESSARGARLIRLSGATGAPTSWLTGFRSIRVDAQEGFRRTDQTALSNDLLPGELRKCAARIAARMWAEIKRNRQGIQSNTDVQGTTTRWSESYITITDAGILGNAARRGFGGGRRGVM